MWRSPALQYCKNSHRGWNIAKWNCAGEYLYRYKIAVGRGPARGVHTTTYLNYDHRESKDVSLFTIYSPVQNLRRGPSGGVPTLIRYAPRGIRVLGDPSETKVHKTCITGVVHKDIWLAGRQRGGNRGLELHTPLRSPWITLQEWR